MNYIDVAIYAVPAGNKEQFVEHAKKIMPIFQRHGALSAVDCWGDDISDGELTSLPLAVKLEPGETVAYSHIVWPSKQTRDEGMAKAMAEMRAELQHSPMPFDGARMIFGGFQTVVGF